MNAPSDIKTIDLSEGMPRLGHLRGPEYNAAIAELVKARGGGCNDAGVYESHDEHTLYKVGRSKAVANVVQTPSGAWLSTIDYQYAVGGGGSAPNVTHRTGYSSKQDAIRAAAYEGYRRFRGLVFRNQGSCFTDSMRKEAVRMSIALLKMSRPPEEQGPSRPAIKPIAHQLDLFQ